MFRPTTTALLMRKRRKRDIHGRESFEPAVSVPVAIVRLSEMVEETPVRADRSATRGAADQQTLQGVLLVGPFTDIVKGDVLKVSGRHVEISMIHSRSDIFGRVHHIEVGGNIKGDL